MLWNKLYRREIVERHHLRMNPEISWCEDFMFNLEYIRYAERFYALQVPIYYYVKTKGSLASQYLSIPKTIRMKLMVFEYYNRFFKTVLDEEEYERSRLKVYKFLVDAAGDGAVPPAILPGSQKLGDERVSVPAQAMEGEGLLLDLFRERKLLEAYVETVALKYDLSMQEIRLLLYLSQSPWEGTRKDLAEILDISRAALTMAVQKLSSRSLVWADGGQADEKKGGRSWRLTCMDEARPVLADLAIARGDFEQACTAGIDPEELARYYATEEKIRNNIRRALQ